MGTITVTGKGSVHVEPDVIRLEVKINSIFKNYNDAYECAKENTAWIGKVLVYNKLKSQLAKTTRFDISDNMVSQYDEDGHYIGQVKQGYELEQRIKIDLDMNKEILNNVIRGIGKYVKDAQINIGYTTRDPRPFQLKMLGRATKDAREKALIMVEALGCQLGDVVSINYVHQTITIYSQARSLHSNEEAMKCSKDSLEINPDDLVISDEVEVVWELKNE